jgi:transketolase
MMDIAVGLAYAGKIPFTYTISPFYWRAAETLRTYINQERLHVVCIGVGVGKDYGHDGPSHDATDIKSLFGVLNFFEVVKPDDVEALQTTMKTATKVSSPYFINVRR